MAGAKASALKKYLPNTDGKCFKEKGKINYKTQIFMFIWSVHCRKMAILLYEYHIKRGVTYI